MDPSLCNLWGWEGGNDLNCVQMISWSWNLLPADSQGSFKQEQHVFLEENKAQLPFASSQLSFNPRSSSPAVRRAVLQHSSTKEEKPNFCAPCPCLNAMGPVKARLIAGEEQQESRVPQCPVSTLKLRAPSASAGVALLWLLSAEDSLA